MAYLDDDDLDAPRDRSGRRGAAALDQRQIFVRRLFALGAGVLVVILLLLAVRGCLDARKERGFENYASDLGAVVNETNQLSENFFNRLRTPPQKPSSLNLEADIATDRGTAQSLLNRVEGLDTPDDLAEAQENLVKAYELRLDALTGISEEIPTALGEEGRAEAIDAITLDMRSLLASDVLFASAIDEINRVFTEQEVAVEEADGGGVVPASIFLPEPVADWIDDYKVSLILSSFAAGVGNVSGVHGLELVSASIDNTPLIAGSENTAKLEDPLEIEAEVSNGGDGDEVDVVINAEISGPTGVVEGEGIITRIEPGQVADAEVTFEIPPPVDVPLTLEVTAQPVPGETLFDNNSLTYTVTFK